MEQKNIAQGAATQKPTPAFLREDYPYPIDDTLISLDAIQPTGVLYEIACRNPECKTVIRTQGVNILRMAEKFDTVGCVSCQCKEYEIHAVNMKKAD